jgi:hypothetical protein
MGMGHHHGSHPSLTIHLDATQTTFDAIRAAGIEDIQAGVADGRVIVVDSPIEVAAMPEGTVGGKPTVFMVFTLPDGRVVMAETTLMLFASAARSFVARYGEPG